MPHFLLTLRPPRDGFVSDITPAEEQVIGAHFEYLERLLADGHLVLAGRTDEGTPTGIALLEAPSIEAARLLADQDPAVKAGIFAADLKAFRLALSRTGLSDG